MEFERYTVAIDQQRAVSPPTRIRGMSTAALLAAPTERHLGELAARIGAPVTALLLALLAIPFSFVNPRAGRSNSLLVAVLTYLIYSNAMSVCQAWIAQGRIGFTVGVVLPHLAVLVVLALMFYKRLAVSPFWRARA